MPYFPVYFAFLWLGVTMLLGVLSGWFSLMQRYPNREETPLLTLSAQSGSMALEFIWAGFCDSAYVPVAYASAW